MKQIVCGYEIEVNRESCDCPTTIRLHKLGTLATSWMTPGELHTLITALSFARQEAEKP